MKTSGSQFRRVAMKSQNSAGKIISVAALIIFAFIVLCLHQKQFSGGAGSASLASALGNNVPIH